MPLFRLADELEASLFAANGSISNQAEGAIDERDGAMEGCGDIERRIMMYSAKDVLQYRK